jgi:S-formylglutathione hydrolase FrmB
VTPRLVPVVALLLIACGGAESHRLETVPLDSAILGKSMPFSVLEPPACPPEIARQLHVVYLLHGYGGSHASLDEEGVSDRLFVAEAEGRIPHVFVVLPQGEHGFYLNWHDGSRRYEDYLVQEAIPAAEKALGLVVPRERRHIAGVSMGGYGALLLGLTHPEMFESIASISGVIFDEEKAIDLVGKRFLDWTIDIRRMLGDGKDRAFLERVNPYSLIEALPAERRPRLFVAVGDGEPDSLRLASSRFHEFLDGRGAEHEWVEFHGGHGWDSWPPVIEKAIAHAVRGAPAAQAPQVVP